MVSVRMGDDGEVIKVNFDEGQDRDDREVVVRVCWGSG